jgi:hypothetical protein
MHWVVRRQTAPAGAQAVGTTAPMPPPHGQRHTCWLTSGLLQLPAQPPGKAPDRKAAADWSVRSRALERTCGAWVGPGDRARQAMSLGWAAAGAWMSAHVSRQAGVQGPARAHQHVEVVEGIEPKQAVRGVAAWRRPHQAAAAAL